VDADVLNYPTVTKNCSESKELSQNTSLIILTSSEVIAAKKDVEDKKMETENKKKNVV